jgi:hypothetical protein
MQPTAPAWPSVNSFDEISRLVRIDYTGGIATQFAYDGICPTHHAPRH